MTGELKEQKAVSTADTQSIDQIPVLLEKAQAAFEADDSVSLNEYCDKILNLDPENFGAWKLLGKFGGWDSKMYDFDLNYILRTINHVMGMVPEEERYDLATEIYTDRKRQISLRLEAALMMPSYQGAKQTHQIMMDWKRLLAETPYLTPGLIESEVTLCGNICTRSKMGVMPNDRLVYTAYATFNKKEPYGETFRKALASRAEKELQREAGKLASVKKEIEDRLASYRDRVEKGELSIDEEKKLLEGDLLSMEKQLNDIEGKSNRKLYQQQLDELNDQLASLKPYKFFKKAEINEGIQALEEKLDQVDAQVENAKLKLQPQIDAIKVRIAEIS